MTLSSSWLTPCNVWTCPSFRVLAPVEYLAPVTLDDSPSRKLGVGPIKSVSLSRPVHAGYGCCITTDLGPRAKVRLLSIFLVWARTVTSLDWFRVLVGMLVIRPERVNCLNRTS